MPRVLTTAAAVLAATAFMAATILMAADEKPLFKFAKGDLGKVPAGWKADKTGKGEGSVWKVVEDDTAPSKSGFALAQTAEGPSSFVNVCRAGDTKYKEVELSVAFKAIAGKKDRGRGFV